MALTELLSNSAFERTLSKGGACPARAAQLNADVRRHLICVSRELVIAATLPSRSP